MDTRPTSGTHTHTHAKSLDVIAQVQGDVKRTTLRLNMDKKPQYFNGHFITDGRGDGWTPTMANFVNNRAPWLFDPVPRKLGIRYTFGSSRSSHGPVLELVTAAVPQETVSVSIDMDGSEPPSYQALKVRGRGGLMTITGDYAGPRYW